jgi:hypothetical protein
MLTSVRRIGLSILGLMSGVAMVVGGAPSAFAGGNGQHVTMYAPGPTNSVAIYGTNQYGNPAKQALNTPGAFTTSYFWWKYSTNFYSFSGGVINGRTSGAYRGRVNANIPKSMSGNYFYVRLR